MGSAGRDFYAILEIDRKADQETIKKAYRRLALKYHPDRNKGDEKSAEEKFREIHEAYAILSDVQKRSEYDLHGVSGVGERPTYHNTADLFNMFNSFFGGDPFSHREFFGGPHRSSFSNSSGINSNGSFGHSGFRTFHENFSFPSQFRSASYDGNSTRGRQQHKVKMALNVTFRDSVLGCSQRVSLEYNSTCENCIGTGAASGRVHDTICTKCGGAGRVRDYRGGLSITMSCIDCGGFGQKTMNPCTACNGSGKVVKFHEEEIVVPPGVATGNTMKRILSPENEQGNEDLYELTVEFQVETHEFFKRKGIDVYIDVPITYTQAVLGDSIQVPSIYGGTTEVTIPPGSQPMSEFILIGQGFFNLEGNGQGDMVIRWVLEVPKALSMEEKKVITQLAQLEQGSLPEKRVQFLQFLCDWDAESVL